MERGYWQDINIDNVKFTVKDIRDKLLPVLKMSETPSNSPRAVEIWAKHLVEECRESLANILPFQKNEIEFLERLQKTGEIKPDLLTDDKNLCQRIIQHPSLLWRTKQVLKIKNKQ